VTGTRTHCDAVVIGAGLAGLSCAARLTRAGCKVAVLEKNSRPGGYGVTHTVRGHRFDIAVQAIGGCDSAGAVYGLVRDTGQETEVGFLACEPARTYYFHNDPEPWKQPGSWQAAADMLGRRFPAFAPAIGSCYRSWAGLLEELQAIAAQAETGAAYRFSRDFPLLARYGSHTLQQFLDEQALPFELQKLLAARSGYCMLPPGRLSLIGFACTEMSYGRGAWLVEGGILKLADALARYLGDHGSSVVCRSRVAAITTHRGRVSGAATRDGRMYAAPIVILAAAVRPALFSLLDSPGLLPARYSDRLARMEQTGSYYVGYYSVPAGAAGGLMPNCEIEEQLETITGSWAPSVYYMLVPSLVDPGAAPPGRHCLCLSIPCPAGLRLGRAARLRCRAMLEQAVVRRFPALAGCMTWLFELAPEQLAAISGNPDGCAYGWALTPEQSGIKRLALTTPLAGLYLAGHWTMPGGGIDAVVTSGKLCAQAIINSNR